MDKVLNQETFLEKLRGGIRDFTGSNFIGEIHINRSSVDLGYKEELILDGSDFAAGLSLCDTNLGSLSLEKVSCAGIIAFYRPTVENIHSKQLRAQRLYITSGIIHGINLFEAKLSDGFVIKATPLEMLILDHCESPYSLFDEHAVKELTTVEARLGRRTPITLGETARV